MSLVDISYINLLSGQLSKFSRKKEYLYNLRCPYCGDSTKNKNRARGYFYRVKNDMFFKCHNCGVGKTFGNFLKDNNPLLYDQYIMERYKNGLTGKNSNTPNPSFDFKKPVFVKNIFSELPKIDSLSKEHIARKYLESRKIPEKFLSKLYYAEYFFDWSASEESKKPKIKKVDMRIVIPFISNDGTIYGYQGRSLNPKTTLRYVTITLNPDYPKVYGLDSINFDETIYVTEGPFDSMFLDNAIAMGGSDMDVGSIVPKKNAVLIFDNEPRNKQIVDKIEKSVDNGYSVVIWPSEIKEKDINDMFLSGLNVQEIVKNNTYSGLSAKVKLIDWKKV